MKVIEEEYDFVGLGFGPANLALSIALQENDQAQKDGLRYHFFDKQPSFAWHSTLLLPGSQLQVSPMKDLATMRDPTSSFTFTNYLHKQGRLAAFINREASIPSRREWSAYLRWAAERMEHVVSYGKEVVRVEPAVLQSSPNGQSYRKLRITLRDAATGDLTVCLTKNLSVAVGGLPVTPEPFNDLFPSQSSLIAHSSTYLPSLASMEPQLRVKEARRLSQLSSASLSLNDEQSQVQAPLRFAVIGSGQSAAEISLHLRKTFPTAHVSLIFRASALVPSDDSAFVNAMAFDPDRTDAFWAAGIDERLAWLQEYRRTNYSVVRSDVLNELHTAVYDQSIEHGQPWPNADGPVRHGRLHVRPNTQVDVAGLTAGEVQGEQLVSLTLKDLKYPTSVALRRGRAEEETETFDAVFLATGFRRSPESMPFLQPLQSLYPRLDPNAERTKAALGFGQEVDSFDVLASLGNDETSCERLRHRTRGITRDYRLVSYSSDAFAPTSQSHSPSTASSRSPSRSPIRAPSALTSAAVRQAIESGSSTPRRGSDISDSETLAEHDDPLSTTQSVSSLLDQRVAIDELSLNTPVSLTEEERRLRGPKMEASIYFLGGNEASHGLSDSLLSIVAHRAGELTTSILKHTAGERGAEHAVFTKRAQALHQKGAALSSLDKQLRTEHNLPSQVPLSPLSKPANFVVPA